MFLDSSIPLTTASTILPHSRLDTSHHCLLFSWKQLGLELYSDITPIYLDLLEPDIISARHTLLQLSGRHYPLGRSVSLSSFETIPSCLPAGPVPTCTSCPHYLLLSNPLSPTPHWTTSPTLSRETTWIWTGASPWTICLLHHPGELSSTDSPPALILLPYRLTHTYLEYIAL